MIKKITVIGIIGLIAFVSAVFVFSGFSEETPESDPASTSESVEKIFKVEPPKGDIIMPTKASRPGCEKDDRCYVPSKIIVERGKPVTWVNEDSAFHSVTSGSYDEPSELFDSGHLDPYESFTVDFNEEGTYDYFCTLHPWMKGQVIVG